MDVIRHQHEGVKPAFVLQQAFAQVCEVGAVVVVVEKETLAIIPALHDVLRNLRQVKARRSSRSR